MYIPSHFRWLEARQDPPADAKHGSNRQDNLGPGDKDPGKDDSGGISAGTTAAIIVCFFSRFYIYYGDEES